MFNYRIVAVINPPTPTSPIAIRLMWGDTIITAVHRGGIASAKRYVERWVAARDSFPGQRRVNKRRAAVARTLVTRELIEAIARTVRW